jgi:hypothetical protein
MKESNLWEWLRDVVLPLGHYSRIESPDTAPGFPDVHYQIGEKGCGTIELKANHRPAVVPFPDEEKGLHVSQLKWIRNNVEEGGVVWIIAETPGAIYIIHGKDAEYFNGATHDTLIEMSWQIIHRTAPKESAKILNTALKTDANFRLFAEYPR